MNVAGRIWTALLLLLTLGFSGCGGNNEAAAVDPEALPEAVAVQKAFASAAPSLRNPVTQTLVLVKAGKLNPSAYAEAMPQLHMFVTNPHVTAEQKKALEVLIERLQREISTRK